MRKENETFKEYQDLGEADAHILIMEVEGPIENALDLRSTIEKLEFSGLGMSAVLSLEEMSKRFK